MKNLKKIGALIIAGIMLTLLLMTSVNVYADPINSSTSGTTLTGTTFRLDKHIILYNVEGNEIYAPNVTLSYSISQVTVAPGTTGQGLTTDPNDGDATTTVSVRSGVSGGVAISNATNGIYSNTTSLTFGTESTKSETTTENAASDDLKRVSQSLFFTVYPAVIYNDGSNPPGIYRYKLSDTTTPDTLSKAGIKERDSSFEKDLYLDLYLKNNENNTGLALYGYVLFKSTGTGDNASIVYSSNATTDFKLPGLPDDEYHTYNLTVEKKISGSIADKTHNFPFKVDITNGNNTSAAEFYYVITTDNVAAAESKGILSNSGSLTVGELTTSSALKFQHDDKIVITGLPVGTTVTVTELNDTNDTYIASATSGTSTTTALTLKDGATTPNTGNTISMTSGTGTAGMNAAYSVNTSTGKDQITFTNNLGEVSPTGVTLRFGPYFIMAAAAVVLLLIMARRRKDGDSGIAI